MRKNSWVSRKNIGDQFWLEIVHKTLENITKGKVWKEAIKKNKGNQKDDLGGSKIYLNSYKHIFPFKNTDIGD